MNMDKKKMAAITTAVFTYIKTEEEALGHACGETVQEPLQSVSLCTSSLNYPSVWGCAGRSSQMQMRSMMQMRAFK
ncbi:MAG: hypothetical protein HQK61_08900 [Desulfamplus sp.]|nr:hypothetical protein [Desulfamplus sp.]